MRTITIQEFEALEWIVDEIEVGEHQLDKFEEPVGLDADGEPAMITQYISWLSGTCLLRAKAFPQISYLIDWTAQGGKASLEDAYDFYIDFSEAGESRLEMEGIELVDDDGSALPFSEAEQLAFDAANNDIDWEVEVGKLLPETPMT